MVTWSWCVFDMSATGLEPDFNLSDPGGEFKTVTHKSRKARSERTIIPNDPQKPSTLLIDRRSAIRRIEEARSDLLSTDLYDSIVASLREALDALDGPSVSEIICLGIGKIGECTTSRYQFALLLCLRRLYEAPVSVYDPIFDEDDLSILEQFNVTVLRHNTEGKHRIPDHDGTVLYYLPHCPKQLSNNLLWVNWGLDLRRCVIIANSFHAIIERNSSRVLQQNAEYISRILPYVLELPVINSFKYYEVFNDTAIHVFPKLNLVSQDFWKDRTEPVYKEDSEFITNHSSEMSRNVSLLRQIISELRYALPEGRLKDSLALQYVRDQFEKYKTTDQQLCKAREEMEFVARCYHSYLRSSRLESEIHNEFHGKGERSIEETAKMVGFKLPHDPK